MRGPPLVTHRGLSPSSPSALAYDKPLCAALDGFTLHAATGAGAHHAAAREALLRYVLRPPRVREVVAHRPRELVARRPNQVWCWDITYLRSAVRGAFYFLCLIVDVYSRKIVGWSVEAEESRLAAARLVEQTCRHEAVGSGCLVLHADNGGPMKGSTMLATLQRLGVVPSFSRPRVSDDNPYAEALFRTLKYRPEYPRRPFATVEQARHWVERFVAWYNGEHLHSSIRFVTPDDRHRDRDGALLAARHALYQRARRRTPLRWTGQTRNWTPIGPVTLNPHAHETQALMRM